MARYDRIAPLTAPTRQSAFPAWTALRDLDGHERDADLARRARLRFLALRPVRRLLDRGIDHVPVESYERQIEGVREELGQLPARDPERARMAAFLHRIRQRTPLPVVAATLELGEVAEGDGHFYAAEEYYNTGLEFAQLHALAPEQASALRLLGRVARKVGRREDAERCYRLASEVALGTGDRRQWARAMEGLGLLHVERGEPAAAGRVFHDILEYGQASEDDEVVAVAASNLCAFELREGRLEDALEHGWAALKLVTEDEERDHILGDMGAAFSALGMHRPAERCYEVIARGSGKHFTRVRAKTSYVVAAAETGDAATFRARRAALLREASGWPRDLRALAHMQLHLGRGCLLVGALDYARDHLRDAIAAAKRHGYGEILSRAGELLTTLEEAATESALAPVVAAPSEVARRIAVEVEALAASSG